LNSLLFWTKTTHPMNKYVAACMHNHIPMLHGCF
jgi:hypothetical protein